MNDKDFQEIGRRLYDQEAEPPKDGWKKISAGIHPPKPVTKFGWLRKNFWIPLALLLPVGFYFYSGETPLQDFKITSSRSADTIQQQAAQESPAPEIPDNTAQNSLNAQAPRSPREKDTRLNSEREHGNSEFPVTQPSRRSEGLALSKSSRSVQHTEPVIGSDESDDDAIEVATGKKEIAESEADNKNIDVVMRTNETVSLGLLPGVGNERNNETKSIPSALASANVSKDTLITLEKKEVLPDSLSKVTTVEAVDEKTKYGHWRVSASFTPYYTTRSVRPIANDEVFVTDINDGDDKFIDRVGLGFALGAGKAITERLFLDAHLAFSQSQQNTFYSYSTGNVDTLLAVEQADRSIRLIPVYEETDRESKSKYTYGGIRLAATYYFLSTPRGRFNIAAAAGVNYLLSSTVKEKVDGRWITLSNDELNKVNYSLIVGAGYNITFNKGWELMINPALTYNLRQVRNNQLPYQLNQRPFGLNVMLSKTLGRM